VLAERQRQIQPGKAELAELAGAHKKTGFKVAAPPDPDQR
jgi:hypothetical protein